VAFYPCCGLDIERPLELLRPYVDEVIFCDSNRWLQPRWQKSADVSTPAGPRRTFLVDDARKAISSIAQINVLFYRKDSDSEGGSGVFVLGDAFLPHLLQRFPRNGGLIITDGSNDRGSNFKRMIRRNGMCKHGWLFRKSPDQPYLESDGLQAVTVAPAEVVKA
jgi:hypothetical protein